MTKQTATTIAKSAKFPPFSPTRGTTLPEAIQSRMFELSATPLKVTAIHKQLVDEFGTNRPDGNGKVEPHGLSKRTVEGFVQEARDYLAQAPRPMWTLLDDDIGEPAIVLETLAEVIMYTSGAVTTFEVDEARMVARIGRAFPTLPVIDRWSLAILYIVRRWRGKRTDDVDTYLAFAPWENSEEGVHRQYNYARAQQLGWVPEQPRPLNSDLSRVNLKHVDLFADWIDAKQMIARSLAQPGARLEFREPVSKEEHERIFERLFGNPDGSADPQALQTVIDGALPRREGVNIPREVVRAKMGRNTDGNPG
jgi:hypothetical protein